MYSIGKPHTLQIIGNGTELVRLTIAYIAVVHSFKQEAYAQIVTAELVGRDIASAQCGFGEIIYVEFLTKRQTVKSVETIAEHLYVGKTLVGIVELIGHCCWLNLLQFVLILAWSLAHNLAESSIERLPVGKPYHIRNLLYAQAGITLVLQQSHRLLNSQPVDKLREVGMIAHAEHYGNVARIGVQKFSEL